MRAVVLQRFNAWFLIVLVALPFTAPFSTCDLSLLLSSPSPGGLRPAISRDGRSESIEEAAPVTATTSILEEEQFKEALLPATAVAAAANLVTGLPLHVVTRAFGMRQTLLALRL